MKFKEFDKPEYFVNRELSWIKFDDRVLSEARDKNLPLFERLKFLSITSSNLDEFYMVRVASLKDQVHAGYKKTDIAGMTAKEQLKAISRQTHDLVHVQYSTLNRSLVPALEKAGLHVIFEHEAFSEKQKEFVDQYFEDNVYPVLTPMAMDSSRPFPLIRNKTLNIGALISKKDKKKDVCDDYLTEWRGFLKDRPYFDIDGWLDYIDAGNSQALIYSKESDEIIRKLSLKIYEATYRILLVWLPEKLHPTCANKLLKIIEEPPRNTVILMVSELPDLVLGLSLIHI